METLNQIWNDWGTIYLIGIPAWFIFVTVLNWSFHISEVVKYQNAMRTPLGRLANLKEPKTDYNPWKVLAMSVVWPLTATMTVLLLIIAFIMILIFGFKSLFEKN